MAPPPSFPAAPSRLYLSENRCFIKYKRGSAVRRSGRAESRQVSQTFEKRPSMVLNVTRQRLAMNKCFDLNGLKGAAGGTIMNRPLQGGHEQNRLGKCPGVPRPMRVRQASRLTGARPERGHFRMDPNCGLFRAQYPGVVHPVPGTLQWAAPAPRQSPGGRCEPRFRKLRPVDQN